MKESYRLRVFEQLRRGLNEILPIAMLRQYSITGSDIHSLLTNPRDEEM